MKNSKCAFNSSLERHLTLFTVFIASEITAGTFYQKR